VNGHQLPGALVLKGKLHDQLLKGICFHWGCKLIWICNPTHKKYDFGYVTATRMPGGDDYKYCDVHAVGRLFTAVAMQRNN
jgi:hypothetical protein